MIKNSENMLLAGWLINWSARGLTISHNDLVAKLAQAGIGDSVARATLPKNAAIRAVKNVMKTIPGVNYKKLRFKAEDDREKMILVIATTSTSTSGQVEIEQLSKVTFDKGNHAIDVEGQYNKELASGFAASLESYESDQFRAIVLRYVKRECSALTYLETGNIYFVPTAKKDELEALKKLFTSLGGMVKLYIKEEVSTKQIRKVMWEVAAREMESEIAKLQEDFADLDNADKVTARTLRLKMEKYDRLKTKIEMFELGLQSTADDLKLKLDSLTSQVKQKLGA